jgi:hypothetical protein
MNTTNRTQPHNQEKYNQQIRAKKEFEAADLIAQSANKAANDANVTLLDYKEQKDRLDNWKNIMATAPVFLFTVIFIIVSIGEYLVSKEIYREFNSKVPWLIAIVFFIAGVFVSEFLAYKMFRQKREWKFYEQKRDRNNLTKTDGEIETNIKKFTLNSFIFGVVLGLALISAIGFLSFKRVQGELAAGMRESGFGVMDIMPVLLYIIEIISGAFVLYLLKETGLVMKVKGLNKKFNTLVGSCNALTGKAVLKYQDAEKENYDPLEVMVSENIHTIFHRHNSRNISDKEKYITPANKFDDTFNIVLKDKEDKPIKRNVTVITDYKFSASGVTQANGKLTLIIVGTYPDDSVKHIFVKESSNSEDFQRITGDYDLDVNKEHELIVG